MLFQIPSNETDYGHPILWQELFVPYAVARSFSWSDLAGTAAILPGPHTLTIKALSKLLMYGNYAKAMAEAQSTTIREIVKNELEQYP